MIGSVRPDIGAIHARELTMVHSDVIDRACPECGNTFEIYLAYCPGCSRVSGAHFHRPCRCGAEWLERPAGHLACLDVTIGDPRFPLICQHCGRRDASDPAQRRGCCATPELSYHDVTDPCDACRRFAA